MQTMQGRTSQANEWEYNARQSIATQSWKGKCNRKSDTTQHTTTIQAWPRQSTPFDCWVICFRICLMARNQDYLFTWISLVWFVLFWSGLVASQPIEDSEGWLRSGLSWQHHLQVPAISDSSISCNTSTEPPPLESPSSPPPQLQLVCINDSSITYLQHPLACLERTTCIYAGHPQCHSRHHKRRSKVWRPGSVMKASRQGAWSEGRERGRYKGSTISYLPGRSSPPHWLMSSVPATATRCSDCASWEKSCQKQD